MASLCPPKQSEEDRGITVSPKAELAAAGGQSSGAAVCNPLGSLLLLSKGHSKTWACSTSGRAGIIRKCRSSKAIGPVQHSWEEFLLYLLPPQGSSC